MAKGAETVHNNRPSQRRRMLKTNLLIQPRPLPTRSCSDATPSRTRGSLKFKPGAAYSSKPTTNDRTGHSRMNTVASISLSATSGGQARHFTCSPTTSYPQQIFTVRNEVFQYVRNTFGQPLFGQPSFYLLSFNKPRYYQPFFGQPSFGQPSFSQPPIGFQFS